MLTKDIQKKKGRIREEQTEQEQKKPPQLQCANAAVNATPKTNRLNGGIQMALGHVGHVRKNSTQRVLIRFIFTRAVGHPDVMVFGLHSHRIGLPVAMAPFVLNVSYFPKAKEKKIRTMLPN